MSDVLIRVLELNGTWCPIGSGKNAGITVSDGSLGADQWGSREATFTLKRNPRAIWPDIGAFTPVEVEVGGVLVWSGRVKETPSRDGGDRQMTVNCEGWQYHLDDDVYCKFYVLTDLTRFVDQRSVPTTDLSYFKTIGEAQIGDGMISLFFPGDAAGTAQFIYPNTGCAATLDLGIYAAYAKTLSVSWSTPAATNNDPNTFFYYRGSDSAKAVNGTNEQDVAGSPFTMSVTYGASGNGSHQGTFTNPKRYVHLLLWSGAGPGAYGMPEGLQITAVQIASDTAYVSGASSILKASQVVSDAIGQATLLLSTDLTKIATTTFSIPDFAMSGMQTPREVINAVNSYENYQARVLVDKRMEFRQRPLDAYAAGTPSGLQFQVDEDAGAVFEDASANSGESIYSSVVVQATGPDGIPISVTRTQSGAYATYVRSAIQPTNPGAEVDTTNWTSTNSALTRTTGVGEFTAGAAGFKATGTADGTVTGYSSAWTGGTFQAGTTYRVSADIRGGGGTGVGVSSLVVTVSGNIVAFVNVPADGSFYSVTATWVQPSSTSPVITVSNRPTFGTVVAYWDNVVLSEGTVTIVQRRGFRRTFVLSTNMSLTTASAQQIGDVFLTQHITTPLKGTLSVSGARGVKRAQGGNGVPPYELLTNTGELMLFPHLTDPDTGGVGRVGVIDAVTYDLVTGTASVSIDNQRSNFEALLGRLAVVTGQVH